LINKADPNARNNDSKTPLELAVRTGNIQTAELIRKYGGEGDIPSQPKTASSPSQTSNWTMTSNYNEMTSRGDYTFHNISRSGAKADLQILCTGQEWKSTTIVLDQPVESRYIDDLFIVAQIRLDNGVPFYHKLFVMNDMRTIRLIEPLNRQFVRAKRIALQYQTFGGVGAVIVIEPSGLDSVMARRYCGANPQE
jgi:hypothetical protein